MSKIGIKMAVDKGIYYDFYNFRLDIEKQQLLKNGEPVQLTHKAFQILLMLVQNTGRTTKKEDIFNELWSDSFVEEANLTQHIYVLRKVLQQTPNGQSYIETVPRQGYRFTLAPEQITIIEDTSDRVQEIHSTEPDALPPARSSRDIEPDDLQEFEVNDFDEIISDSKSPEEFKISESRSSEPLSKSRQAFLIPLLVLFAVLIPTALAIYYFRQQPRSQTIVIGDVKSIAVLPFNPIGGEIDKEKLGLGMADAIITRLSKLKQIIVRPTSTVFRYTDKPAANAVSAGRDLGVDAVLEGTIQSDDDRIKVSVQLIRVTDGKPLWAESFQEKVADIFTVQDSISSKVATALSINLTKQQAELLAQRATNSPEAFQAYQLGAYFLNRRQKEDLTKAVEHFEQAITHDPNYAQAYAGLADTYSMLAYYNFADVDEMKEKAKATAEKALSLNDSLADAYVALAVTYIVKRENFIKAQELLERAITLDPYNASARHRYGWILLANGKLNEGAHELRLAREYDPLSPATNRAYCSVLVMQRNFPEALKQCETTIDIYVNTPNSRRDLARAYFYNGKYPEAFNQLEIQTKLGTEDEINSARSEMAYCYAKLGKKADAEKIYAELKWEYKKKPRQAFDLTLIAYALGRKDEALAYFKEMLKDRDKIADSNLFFAYDPYWDEIKKDPDFAPLFPK